MEKRRVKKKLPIYKTFKVSEKTSVKYILQIVSKRGKKHMSDKRLNDVLVYNSLIFEQRLLGYFDD